MTARPATSALAATERDWHVAMAITLVAAAVRLAFAAVLPLYPDETYYWDWSRHLASGYFDHPPAIAVLIWMGTALYAALGAAPTPLAIRLFPVIAGGIAAFFATLVTRRIGGSAAARMAALFFALMPLAASGLVLATPDAPLLATTSVSLYAAIRAIETRTTSAKALPWWIVAGAFLGLAFSSKYTSILLPVTLTAAIIVRPSLRHLLKTPGPYVACLVATLVFLPVLHWNGTHDWISFRFQLQHGLGTPKGSPLKREADLIGGQLALVSPILFVLAAAALPRALRRGSDDVRFTLAMVAAGSWVFFLYSALRKAVEANWPAPAYLAALPLLAALIPAEPWSRWMRRGTILAAVMVCVIYVQALHPVLPLPARRDPLARNAGWGDLAAAVQSKRSSVTGVTHVAADRYQDVSELAYHLPGRPQAFCTCLGGRHNQYELWPSFRALAKPGDNLVIVLEDTSAAPGSPTSLAPYFESVERGALVALRRGNDTIGVRRLWTLASYRGGWPPARLLQDP